MALTDHDTQRDCMRSLLAMADDAGYVPKWPAAACETNGMIGTSADVVFADSAIKGVEGIDYAAALDVLKRTADGPTAPGQPIGGRGGIQRYLELGWVPADENGASASVTLEYAYDDGALANMARKIGRADDAERYARRSLNWRNLFDPETKFLRARNADGSWTDLGNPARGFDDGDYREGTAWNWRVYAPHDPEGLRDAYGGPEAFGAMLEEMFSKSALGKAGPIHTALPDPYYWQGNETDLHAPWLFAFTDRPERLDHWVREIQTRLYTDKPDGLAGNDDGGALSSWYLFSAIGLFPLAGTERYVIGPPVFPRVEVDLGGGGVLKIEAPGASHDVRLVRGVTRDGAPVDGRTLRHADLAGGTTLRFTMGREGP
jgi:predicted alpha-1,2-mannosidase